MYKHLWFWLYDWSEDIEGGEKIWLVVKAPAVGCAFLGVVADVVLLVAQLVKVCVVVAALILAVDVMGVVALVRLLVQVHVPALVVVPALLIVLVLAQEGAQLLVHPDV